MFAPQKVLLSTGATGDAFVFTSSLSTFELGAAKTTVRIFMIGNGGDGGVAGNTDNSGGGGGGAGYALYGEYIVNPGEKLTAEVLAAKAEVRRADGATLVSVNTGNDGDNNIPGNGGDGSSGGGGAGGGPSFRKGGNGGRNGSNGQDGEASGAGGSGLGYGDTLGNISANFTRVSFSDGAGGAGGSSGGGPGGGGGGGILISAKPGYALLDLGIPSAPTAADGIPENGNPDHGKGGAGWGAGAGGNGDNNPNDTRQPGASGFVLIEVV